MPTVIITGASGGLGTALTVAFGANGYGMILQCNSRDVPKEIHSLTKEKVDVVKGDLRLFAVMDQLGDLAKQRKADILINNAAEYFNQSFDQITDCDIRRLIDVNLITPMLLTRRVWEVFQENGSGMIININSLAGKDGGKGESLYCASKHGLSGFSKALQFDGTKDNVRVIDVFIGGMKTGMTSWRSDQDKLIDPIEVATVIEQMCVDPDSMRINEITLTRKNY